MGNLRKLEIAVPGRQESGLPSAPEPEPAEAYDAESSRPFREAFARRLPPEVRRALERQARESYGRSLESHQHSHSFPDGCDLRGLLKAAAVDLRETAALLEDVTREGENSDLDPLSTVLSMFARPRRLEVEAVAERVEMLLEFRPTPAHPFPPDLASPGLRPRACPDAPVEPEKP